MNLFRPRIYGDSERWQNALNRIKDKSLIEGDNKDIEFLESLLDNSFEAFTTEEKIQLDTTVIKQNVKLRDLTNKYRSLCEQYDVLLEKHDILLALQEHRKLKPIPLTNSVEGEAVILLGLSDWHVGEIVSKGATNGLNEYNPTICRKRVEALTNNTIKLIKKEASYSNVKAIVIHLGGDFINGWIHEENKEANSMTPLEEVQFALELLESYLNTLLQNTDIPIKCVCNVGNHGRFTAKYRFENENQTSFETFLYSILAKTFSGRVEFAVAESSVHYENILGKSVRFYHGHQIKFAGGVGGLTIPLNKIQARWDSTIKADVNVFGHYHTCSMPNNKSVLNGSLVGYNAMAQFMGLPFEPPKQSFCLLHSKYGLTAFHGIVC